MGQKYTSQSASGYNSSAPADDGSTVAANKITWSTIKTKLSDVLKTFIEAVNTALVTALDTSASTTSVNYTTLATDHLKPIEVTAAITISLGDAATMGAGYQVTVRNKHTAACTVAVVTATDTLNGLANGTVSLLPGEVMTFGVNQAVNGYGILSAGNVIQGVLSSVAGTNTITANAAPKPFGYAAGQEFTFIPANTNTGATTLNINSLGAKNVFFCGAACSGGEIKQSVPCRVQYDGTQFNIIGPVIGSRLTASLGADVNLNNTGSYFDGPSVAQGTVGTWFVSGTVTVRDSITAAAQMLVKLWDGTTVIASTLATTTGTANRDMSVSLSGYISSPAGNLRISVNDASSTSGVIKFNASSNSKDSTISAVRIA